MQDVIALDATVQAAEQQLKQIQACIQQEKQAMVKAQAVRAACAMQLQQLQHLSSNLPARLPEPSQPAVAQQVTLQQPAAEQQLMEDDDQDENCKAASQQPLVTKTFTMDKKKKARAPRRWHCRASNCVVFHLWFSNCKPSQPADVNIRTPPCASTYVKHRKQARPP